MRVGILTGGGDCPGLNAVIRAVVRVGLGYGHEHVGIRRGWRGLLEGTTIPLDMRSVSGILPRGGTILGTSRTNPYKRDGGPEQCMRMMGELGLDALVAIGGEDTLGVADKLHKEHGMKVVGVPKTIDNDLSGTDFTFGFDTAVQIATEAIDRLHTTAESHDRVMVCEVMGRHAGWIALYAGLAGGADQILIPERPANVADVIETVLARHRRGKDFSIIVVSEGVVLDQDQLQEAELDEFGHPRLSQGSVGERLGQHIKDKTGFDTRVTVLGHIQRGGTPTAHDRVLSTRFGANAARLVEKGRFGHMVALRGNEIVDVPLADAVAELKTVPDAVFRIAEPFFG
ncbi:MAG: 6-phosphofructokinase [Thermoleophilia bacterium]|jgi:6-phosphofructokinase 1|nr:6-phosphofructokinase [Thermoleophilia bacterium]